MGIKLRTSYDYVGNKIYIFDCPGCGHKHYFNNRWSFNGNMENPTFSPSLLNYNDTERCHLYVNDGKIEYLPDCTHDLAGKTKEMEDVKE